jgi:hypothetical protein
MGFNSGLYGGKNSRENFLLHASLHSLWTLAWWYRALSVSKIVFLDETAVILRKNFKNL